MALFGQNREDVTERFIDRGIDPKRVEREIVDYTKYLEEKFRNLTPLMDLASETRTPIAYRSGNNKPRVWIPKQPMATYEYLLKGEVSQEAIEAVVNAYLMEKGNNLWYSLNAINYANAIRDVPTKDELRLQELFGELLLELETMEVMDLEVGKRLLKRATNQTVEENDINQQLLDDLMYSE